MTATAAKLLKGESSLEFYKGQLLFRTSKNGSGESYKFLNLETVAAAFRQVPVDSGWLPPGVMRCGSTAFGDFAVLSVPARVHPLNVEAFRSSRNLSLKVPLPAFVFLGIGKSYFVWSTNGDFDPRAPLFHAPLPNVFENGSICWGSNKPPKASVDSIRKAWALFITSPFSGHAANGKSVRHNSDVRHLLCALDRKRRFPLGDLVQVHRTIAETVDRALGDEHVDGPEIELEDAI